MQKIVVDLEQAYHRMRQSYEAEISTLKAQLEAARAAIASAGAKHGAALSSSRKKLNIHGNSPRTAAISADAGGRPSGSLFPGATTPQLNFDFISPSLRAQIDPHYQAGLSQSSGLPASSSSIAQQSQRQAPHGTHEKDHDWNVHGGRSDLLGTLNHPTVVCSVRLASHVLLATGSDRLCRVYEIKSAEKISATLKREIVLEGDIVCFVRSIAITGDERLLALGSEDARIRLYDLQASGGQAMAVLRGHTKEIFGLEFVLDTAPLISASGDGTIRYWTREDTSSWRQTKLIEHENREHGFTSVSARAAMFAAGSTEGLLHVFETDTGRSIAKAAGHRDSIYSVFFYETNMIATASLDRTIRLWTLAGGQLTSIRTLTTHADIVLSINGATIGNETILVSCSKDLSICVQAVSTASLEGEMPPIVIFGHSNTVMATASKLLSKLSRTLLVASAGGDGRVRLWRVFC